MTPTAAAIPEDRHGRILAELAGMGLELARDLRERALAAETAEEATRLARAFQAISRGVRQTLALVGLQLLRDFTPDGAGWRGKVFAPDLNRTFSGTARPLDAGRLEARGCLLGRVLCKRQVWTRVEGEPGR